MVPRKKHNWDDAHRKKVEDSWIKFKNHNDLSAREFLITSYLPMVDRYARQILAKKPAMLQYEDLYQAGVVGLIDAIEKFELERENEFHSYAPLRIKGAILDSVNAMDWTPRSTREDIRAVLKATEDWVNIVENGGLSVNYNDKDYISFLQEKTSLSEDKIKKALVNSSKTFISPMQSDSFSERESISKKTSKSDRDISRIVDFITLGDGSNQGTIEIDKILNEDEIRELLTKMTLVCTPTQKKVLLLIFWKKYTLKQTAKALNHNISWVAKTRDEALRKLGDNLSREDFDI